MPAAFEPHDDAEVDAVIRAAGAGDLITSGAGRLQATRLPVVWDRSERRLIAHMARANEHWRTIPDASDALFIVTAPDAYVSPSWYAAKAEHGRVVPTWDYGQVQLRGRVSVHDDAEWLRDAVERLTDLHEQHRDEPWAVEDAPERYVGGLLRAIVGIEVQVDAIEASLKFSQNRSEADRRGVVAGLEAEGDPRATAVAADVAHRL